MHTVNLLEFCLDLAKKLGYEVRRDWLDGEGGGSCVLRGKKLLFLDLALDPGEQLERVLDVLRREPQALNFSLPNPVRELLVLRQSA
jgi:hypothetical protein